MSRILHIVPGLTDLTSGISAAVKLIAARRGDLIVDITEFRGIDVSRFGRLDGVCVHGMWTPDRWAACLCVIRSGVRLIRMTHGSLSPLCLRHQGKWKKRLVTPIERWLFRRTDRVVVTCEAEKKWCREWGLMNEFEVVDLKKYFHLSVGGGQGRGYRSTVADSLHVLYLGRRHPLKGVEFLERAVEELRQLCEQSNNRTIDLRIVSNAFGEEKEKVWDWCDVLVLPTLSENFGLVVAEALERGKCVITTDGAPVWKGQVGVCYLEGFVVGTETERVRMLRDAICKIHEGGC